MVGITAASQTGKKESTKPSTQVTNEDEKVFEKEEHQLIYETFLATLNPEKQIQQIEKKLQEKLSEQEAQELQSKLKSLNDQLKLLGNEDEKKILTFIFENSEDIFKNVNQESIKSLSEENFSQFLLAVFKKIREKKLANEENLKSDEIKKVVKDCVSDIRGTEARDSLVKIIGWPLGIKIDPKNISGSFMSGIKEKIPFLGGSKKEEDEPPLSDGEMVTTFLRKIFLPTFISIALMLVFGPTTFAVVGAVIGAVFAVKGGFEVLFSNNRKGTLYNPDTKKEEGKEWDKEISVGISKVLKTPVKEAEKDKKPALTTEKPVQERGNSEPSAVPEQLKANGSFQEKEDNRRQKEEEISRLPK
ncbi:hypothetical protein [Wolbachia endosymbiont of Atemnus politus]|uniref:hypothetical protein n=1 Tax=Wolbachia endosymbiont of Atemnus politus TaxID=2682840 RepID=UPI001574A20E|nr:hypothetical protein [Wolbachia endosymbiont of Atemnus politus]